MVIGGHCLVCKEISQTRYEIISHPITFDPLSFEQTHPEESTIDDDDPYGSDLPTMVPRPSVVMHIPDSQLNAAVNGINQESPEEGGHSEKVEGSESDGSQSGRMLDIQRLERYFLVLE